MSKLIFLSHIHEEKELALIIQNAIEDEFSGFVTVFVSSDGNTIPAGSNFLKIIEKGLIKCVGAIYLISPMSVKRNWINFELGAVWIRNVTSELENGQSIPVIPLCHSGITVSTLPSPLSNLNAIQGNLASSLEFAFKSIQTAVGGSGRLKSDFPKLEQDIRKIENQYMIGDKVVFLFLLLKINKEQLSEILLSINNMDRNRLYTMTLGVLSNEVINQIKDLQNSALKNHIELIVTGMSGMFFSSNGGNLNGAEVSLKINTSLLIDHLSLLRNRLIL